MPDFADTPDACTPAHLSVDNCKPKPKGWLATVEVVCVIIFTVDYIVRIGLVHSAHASDIKMKEDQMSKSMPAPLQLTLRYSMQTLNLVDLMAILPFYIEMAVDSGDDLAMLRVLRLVRLFRLLKSPKLQLCGDMFLHVLQDALPALMTLFFMTTLMCVLFAACIVFAESSWYSVDQFPDDYPTGTYIRPTADGHGLEVSPFTSIPYAFWWFFVTSTTVGYGDDYPTTTAGRLVAIVAFYFGIVLLALPLTIVGQSFHKFFPSWVKNVTQMNNKSPAGLGLHGFDDDGDSLDGEQAIKCPPPCGNILMDDAAFCRKCGKARSEIRAPSKEGTSGTEALRLTANGEPADGGMLQGITEETPAEVRKQEEATPAAENDVEEIALRQSLPPGAADPEIALIQPGAPGTEAKVDDIGDFPTLGAPNKAKLPPLPQVSAKPDEPDAGAGSSADVQAPKVATMAWS